ncbi:MAG: CPBP family glutamic-type intramembrane protease, partial [Candidatus Dormibacteraeota bacterium]|nr:CPBP family glutamic-type intramembrane protease [Candidatus Dormibacteraeota bacterium]
EAGRQKEAVAAYERALELEPNNDIARTGYRWTLAAPGSAVHADLAPAHVTADRAAAIAERPPRPHVQLDTQAAFMVLVPYLILLAIAELAVTFVNPVLVFPLHGGMITLAAIHVAFLERNAGTDPKARYLAALLLTLMLSPLIRIISLTLPLSQIDAPYRFLFAGIPMVIGAVMVARYVGFRPRWIGLVWRDGGWQVVAIEASIFLGFIEYAILRPEPLAGLPWTAAGWLPALAVSITTGFPEELIFRGMMQTASRPLIGSRWSVIYVSLVFAVLHIGYKSVIDLVFVLAVGLLYGWLFERSRSIIGLSIGHGVANVVLFFVAPNLLGH